MSAHEKLFPVAAGGYNQYIIANEEGYYFNK